MLIEQFLNITPIVILLQLAVWVWYIDKYSIINRIMAVICLMLAIENTMMYSYYSKLYVEYELLISALDISIWGVLYILIIYYLILIFEHPFLTKTRWLGVFILLNTPLIFSPLVTIPIANGYLVNWEPYFGLNAHSVLSYYYSIASLAVMGMMIYILTYARFTNTNYRIQKQAMLIIRAFIFVIVTFLPQLVIWTLGYQTPNYMVLYPELIFFSVVIYSMSKYRAQSLSTSSIVTEMIDHASELTMVILPNGEILSANNHSEKFLGYKKHEIEQSSIFNIIDNEVILRSELNKIENEQNYTPVLDLNIRLHNGSYLFIRTGITAIRNKFREILGYYFVFYAPVEEVKQFEDLQTRFGLSSREKDVAMLLVKGMSNQEIADQLYISLATVKTHSNNIYRKTATTNKLELKKMVV